MNLSERFKNKRILLGSASPRRKQLLSELGLSFDLLHLAVDEAFPSNLKRESIALFLSALKATAGKSLLQADDILITADTIVWLAPEVLNKPMDEQEAKRMLYRLSGKTHEVITAVTITSTDKTRSVYSVTEVTFRSLLEDEIQFYIQNFKPFDKAGAYGIQEWIGHVGVERINGSYTNVVGLPLNELYNELMSF
jgi:septum formation protein